MLMAESKKKHWKEVFEILLCIVAAVVFFTALNYAKNDHRDAVTGYDGRPQLHQTYNKN